MNQKDLNYMLSASAIDSYIHFFENHIAQDEGGNENE